MIVLWLYIILPINALPNFVFVLTDDQDLLLRSLDYMNKTTKLLANKGTTFSNFYVNSPICCPSRSTILTGKYPHNTHVYNNSVSGGCSSQNWELNHEQYTIAPLLKSVKNYKTFYAGKYLNQYENLSHVPPGYDWWIGLKGNSRYYNYSLSINGSEQYFRNDYLTDKIKKLALDFLNIPKGNFFMMLAPPACHAPFTPAPRHEHLFPNLGAIRGPPFNTTPVNKHWLVEMTPRSLPEDVKILDEIYRNRIRTLQAVDDLIEALILKLEALEVLQNTYVFLVSDNGYHIGQFTQPWDKRQPYESDIRVPMIVRGPQVPKKTLTEFPVSTVDILPTILDLAEIQNIESDGRSFKKELLGHKGVTYGRKILIEYWGESDPQTIDPGCPFDNQLSQCVTEAWCKCQDSKNNTYRCILDLSNSSQMKYCVFDSGFMEIYDLLEDPHEFNNLRVPYDLTLLEELKRCKGTSCH